MTAERTSRSTRRLLEGRGLTASEFATPLCERYAEYVHYREWLAERGYPLKNTVLGEYANKIGAIVPL
jgi:hypothetical protein